MLYADSYYKHKAEKGLHTILLPELNRFDKFLWKIKGYKVFRLPEDPERKSAKNIKKGYWEQGDMYDIGDVCSICGYDSGIEPCYLSHCPSCHAEMKTL